MTTPIIPKVERMETKTPQEALREMLEIEANLISYKSQFEIAKLNNWDKQKNQSEIAILHLKIRAKQIADEFKFKGGCGKFLLPIGSYKSCGNKMPLSFNDTIYYCDDCQAEKEDCDKIQEVNKEVQHE